MNRDVRTRAQLEELLAQRILVLDGAMGTALQGVELGAGDYGGEEYEGCPEILVATRPDVVTGVHDAYLSAGADIIETNTFGGTPIVLAEYGLEDRTEELNEAAARLAKAAATRFSTTDRPRFVAGSVGPTTKAITVTGGVSFDGLVEHFRRQLVGLLRGGVDLVSIETQQDTRNAKAAYLGYELAAAEVGRSVPVMVMGTIEPTGTMLAGQAAEAFCVSLQHADLLAIGLNCATGPEFMTDSIRSLSEMARTRVSCMPNAGLPDVDGSYSEGPAAMAAVLERFVDAGWLNLLGGCCGTTPEHVQVFAQMVQGKAPRRGRDHHRALYSGIDLVESTEDNRPLLVGERTNVIGSRRFKKLIQEGKYEEASEIARLQAKAGAQILDVCLADPDREERTDMDSFLAEAIKRVKLPLMIDSTDSAVIDSALRYSQGKAIINSINLEDGEERFAEVVPLARKYGAALVVGTIDEDPEQGMAVTRERKLAVAERSYELLVGKYGVRPEDIIWDPLTFPCATGDANYVGSAVETIEGIRLIKERFPETRTILGVSNVSFGLPPAGREVLNAVFLYHCTKAGLDLAIVNTERLERFARIGDEERRLAEDLLFDRGDDPIAAFADHFRGAKRVTEAPMENLTLDERLARYIIEGSKEGLIADLELKRREAAPLEIINGPLMDGMSEVGRLFNANELIVAEVLQSAEAMKAAVSHLESYMEKADAADKGKVILATVKGDVHDIGKNLVDIILSNNGYRIVNLGIKIPPEVLIEAVREHRPDAIGLSGLLVKSAQQMVLTGQDLSDAGIDLPLLVGGAALSSEFTRQRIAPAYGAPTMYARDAMDGLALVNRILAGDGAEAVVAEQEARRAARPRPTPVSVKVVEGSTPSSTIDVDLEIPPVDDLDRHVETITKLDEIWSYINPQMLYGKHMGLRGNVSRLLEAGDEKAVALRDRMLSVMDRCRDGGMQVGLVHQFFEAERRGNDLRLYSPKGELVARWTLPRQRKHDGLCVADLVLPPVQGRRDHVALFITTAGTGIRERSEELKEAGEYVESHALAALAIETAEASAEWLHARLRAAWGFPDPEDLTMLERFQARYRGKRYSFGYPACPDLSGQTRLFELLSPEDIGVSLTEGFMMEPEASVSGLVFHHPDARYFGVGPAPLEDSPA